jgi:hypothetical protein
MLEVYNEQLEDLFIPIAGAYQTDSWSVNDVAQRLQ